MSKIFRDRGSKVLLGFIVFFICSVFAALIYVPIILNFQTQALQSFRTDLECMECCLGNQQCVSDPKCKERLSSSDDVSYCRLTPDYSRAKIAEVVEDKILAQRNYDVIDQVVDQLQGNYSEERFRDIEEGFSKMVITAQRPFINLPIGLKRKTRSTGFSIRWFCKNGKKKDLRCSENGEIKITTGGYYSYHLRTTFKESRPSQEQKDHSIDVSHQLIKKVPGRDHTLVDEITHCRAGRCTLESTGVVYLSRGDQMNATYKIPDSRFKVSEFPSESYFSLFMISTPKRQSNFEEIT